MHIIQINANSAHIPTPVQEEGCEEAGKEKCYHLTLVWLHNIWQFAP